MEKALTQKDKEDRALHFGKLVQDLLLKVRANTLKFAEAMDIIQSEGLFTLIAGHDNITFDEFCKSPEIAMDPNTVKKYIRIVRYYKGRQIELDGIKDISMNKLSLIRQAKKPTDWFNVARQMSEKDFKIHIYEKELGIDQDDKQLNKDIDDVETQDQGCEFWDGKKCIKGLA